MMAESLFRDERQPASQFPPDLGEGCFALFLDVFQEREGTDRFGAVRFCNF